MKLNLQERLIANGRSPELFNEVVKAYHERVYWVIRKIVLNHEETNDLTQESFIKIWNNLDQFNGDSKLYTWVYRIATNTALEHLRKAKRRHRTGSINDPNYVAHTLIADEYFDGDKLLEDLHNAVTQLPEKQQLVFQLKYFEGLKYDAISEITGTSVGSLKANYHHAKEKIKKMLARN